MKGRLINFNAAMKLSIATCLFILAGCGGGNGSSELLQNPITQSTAQFKETAIVSGPGRFSNLIISGPTLFWGDGSSGKGIWKYNKGDTSPQLLVPRLAETSNMIVRGNYAYWINTEPGRTKFSIYRTTLDGSQTSLLTQGDVPFLNAYLAVDDKALYFTAKEASAYATNSASVVLQRFPLDGSAPTTLYHLVKGAVGLASDDNYIYVLDETGADSYAANLVRISKTDGSSQCLSQNIAQVNGAITVASGVIYVGTHGKLLKVTATGGTPTVLASGSTVEPYMLTVLQDNIYLMNYDRYENRYTIETMPVGGGNFAVVAIVSQPSNFLARTDGLYWTEPQGSGETFAMVLKKRSWQTGQATVVADGTYISSFDISDGKAYLTQYLSVTGFSEVSMVSLADGLVRPLIGGLNTTAYTFTATKDNVLIGDGSALKKAPVSGGVTTTLIKDVRFDLKDVKEQDGAVYFTSDGTRIGLFKTSEAGGSCVALAQEPGVYGSIISVQDGYVYYVHHQYNLSGGTTAHLRRVRVDGTAPSESYFTVPSQYSLERFDGIEAAYLEEPRANNQYNHVRYDIASGKVVQLVSGIWSLKGFDSSSVFYADYYNNIYQVPKTGGKMTPVISLPYPLELPSAWVSAGNGLYAIVSYMDPTKGYLSEVNYLEKIK